LVVIEKASPRNGRALEIVGNYNPVAQPQVVNLKHERIAHWMKMGAQPTDVVKRLLKKHPAPAEGAVEAPAEAAPTA
jgi:small subunit ribosomal protein S16